MGRITAHVRAGDVELFAQCVDQQLARFGKEFVILAVHVQFDMHLICHCKFLPMPVTKRAR